VTNPVVPLAEIVEELENGSRPEGGVDYNGDVFSVGGEHLNDFGEFDFSSVKLISHDFFQKMKRGKVKPNDIIIVKDGATTGKTSFVTDKFPFFPCAINEHVFRLSVRQAIADPRYVFYYLYSPKGNREILDDFRGATVGGISQEFVSKVFIPLPPLSEQQRIASLLTRADRLRRLRRHARELSDSLLQSVFLEMFGDPATNPKGWNIVELGDKLIFITSGSRGWAEYYSDKGDLFLRVQNLGANQLLLNDVAFVQAPDNTESRRTKVQSGDLLLSATADIGRTGVIPDNFPTAYINQHLFILRLKELNPYFVAGYFSTPNGKAQILRLDREGVKLGLNFDDANCLKVFIPPLALQEQFTSVVTRHKSLRSRQAESARQAEGLFQSMLSEAFRS
jgi:type I restriction enzyme S subunit